MQGLIGLSKNKFFQTLLNLGNLAYFLIGLKRFKMSPNGIKIAVFSKKNVRIAKNKKLVFQKQKMSHFS